MPSLTTEQCLALFPVGTFGVFVSEITETGEMVILRYTNPGSKYSRLRQEGDYWVPLFIWRLLLSDEAIIELAYPCPEEEFDEEEDMEDESDW